MGRGRWRHTLSLWKVTRRVTTSCPAPSVLCDGKGTAVHSRQHWAAVGWDAFGLTILSRNPGKIHKTLKNATVINVEPMLPTRAMYASDWGEIALHQSLFQFRRSIERRRGRTFSGSERVKIATHGIATTPQKEPQSQIQK